MVSVECSSTPGFQSGLGRLRLPQQGRHRRRQMISSLSIRIPYHEPQLLLYGLTMYKRNSIYINFRIGRSGLQHCIHATSGLDSSGPRRHISYQFRSERMEVMQIESRGRTQFWLVLNNRNRGRIPYGARLWKLFQVDAASFLGPEGATLDMNTLIRRPSRR